jgi:uncharacterized tellurite resistance protein B-like protein
LALFDRIKSVLEPKTAVPADVEHQLRLATGALLLEMCRADFKIMPEERQSIANSIKATFKLTPEETFELMEEAESESECAVSLQIYTSLIADFSSVEQKLQLIQDLWQVAFADGELHALEENLVIRVASLIDVSSRSVQDIRERVEFETGYSEN